MITVSGYDGSGYEISISKVKTDDLSTDEQVKVVGDMLRTLFYMGVLPNKPAEKLRGIENQWITHFVLRKKKDGGIEADLFSKYQNMKCVTLYLGDDGMEENFLKKSGLNSLEGIPFYPAGSFDKGEAGEDSEYFIKCPTGFMVTIKPNGVYKEGKAAGKQRMKAIL